MTDIEIKREMEEDMAKEYRHEQYLRTDFDAMLDHIEADTIMFEGYLDIAMVKLEQYGWDITRKELLERLDIC